MYILTTISPSTRQGTANNFEQENLQDARELEEYTFSVAFMKFSRVSSEIIASIASLCYDLHVKLEFESPCVDLVRRRRTKSRKTVNATPFDNVSRSLLAIIRQWYAPQWLDSRSRLLLIHTH